MTRTTVSCLTLIALTFSDCYARCLGFPVTSHLESDVTVWSCAGVTFEAGKSTFYDLGTLHRAGASVSGTVLDIEIKSSRLVRDSSAPREESDYEPEPWKPGEQLAVFVAAPADEVCPKSVPSALTVATRDLCCDVLPRRGDCLVPRYLQIVEVVRQ